MSTSNPERLWACVCFVGGPPGICADFERDDVLCDRPGAAPAEGYTPIVEYVREDVADDEARLFRDQRNILASKLATAEDEATALRRERDALRLAMKVADGRIYLLRDALCLIEGDFSASSEQAKSARDRDNALRDGTWTPPVDPACRCGHPASVHAVDDEERRQCLRGECDCGQYDHDAAAAGKGAG